MLSVAKFGWILGPVTDPKEAARPRQGFMTCGTDLRPTYLRWAHDRHTFSPRPAVSGPPTLTFSTSQPPRPEFES